MNGNLPKQLLTWRLVQDHINKDLLFAATENGVYFTSNGGGNWSQLKGGMPTIAIRDITIQRRENDLVAASFGRGFYILDDISPLREFNTTVRNAEATLFDVKPAYWYVPKSARYAQGSNQYAAKNPEFGAIFTYYLKDSLTSLKSERKLAEKGKASVPFPGWDALEKEKVQPQPKFLLSVTDSKGQVVNVVEGTNKKGFNRVNWALDVADRGGEELEPPKETDDYYGGGVMVTPGDYSVVLSKLIDGQLVQVGGPKSFKVVPLAEGALKGASYEEIDAFREAYEAFKQDLKATSTVLKESTLKVQAMQRAMQKATSPSADLVQNLYAARTMLQEMDFKINGNPAKNEIGERNEPSPNSGNTIGRRALTSSTYGPTANQQAAFEAAQTMLKDIKTELNGFVESQLPTLEAAVKSAGAPWIEGQGLIKN